MAVKPRDTSYRQLALFTACFVILTCLAILTFGTVREVSVRRDALKNSEVDLANLAQSLVQHAEDSFELADSVVVGLVHRLEAGGTDPAAIASLQSEINLRKAVLGRVRGLFVYDHTGRWLATTEPVNLNGLNNSDREYFQRHQNSPDTGLLIGNPVKSRSGGQWIIPASRRFNNPDGSFAGVVLATIDSSYFADFYRQFDLGPTGVVTLLKRNGFVLARSVDNGSAVGQDTSETALIKEMHSRPPASVHYFKSQFDGTWRLGFYRLSERFPIFVLATEAKDEVLSAWRRDAIFRLAVGLGLVALIAGTGFYLVRQLLERQRMGAALSAKEADFRLLAEKSSDVVMRIDLDERIRYVSPACLRVLGWSAEQLLGTPALAGINPEDLPLVRETVELMKRGEIEETRFTYRTRHRQAREVWLETALRATHNTDNGKVSGVVAISRDVTEQKNLEGKLAMLAVQDGLTGLANRRHFDNRLQQEWRRAERNEKAISLLMIDVDNFKKYNDQHGHQAGDACLKAIAELIATEARRPSDLAARYGGEEFGLLLPNTDEVGCASVAARLQDALRYAAIPHVKNLPTRLVTLSVGGATAWPTAETVDNCATLVTAADRALFVAKNAGRDRFVMSGQVVAWRGIEGA